MSKWIVALSLITVSLLVGCLGFTGKDKANETVKVNNLDTLKAAANYSQYCGGCHGEKMDMFVDRQWKHGNTREDLFKAVKFGYADEGMPGFEAAFSDKEIYELADYMLAGIQRFKTYEFEEEPKSSTFTNAGVTVTLDTIVSGLKSVWAIAFLPDEEMLITEKFGTHYRIDKNKNKHAITGVPEVVNAGQGGLLDVILHPDFASNQTIYITYSAGKKEGGKEVATTALMKARLVDNQLQNQQVIFEAFPYTTT